MRIPLPWLDEFAPLEGKDAAGVAAALVTVGLEEEAIHGSGVTGSLVAGRVVSKQAEPQKNGKTINWCQVDVGSAHGAVRGIVCGADNFGAGDLVAVALPGAQLPGPFPITARKTYGHVSDGMICSERELGLGEDHTGIIVLASKGIDAAPGTDLIPLLHLDEQTVEINVTPDRGYCFSVRGVAREFAHATGVELADPAAVETPSATADGFAVEVDDTNPLRGQIGCDRFVARVVRGVDPAAASPAWMQRRLNQAGMRPISLAVDITNYVMLELGQPLHAYDLHQVAAPIVVRRALPGEDLVTLDEVERALDLEDLLITDSPDGLKASRVLGLAGVMGGASSEVRGATHDLLIEAAHFDPISVARTARRHKLSSEAAKRFERGVDPELAPKAAERVVELLVRYGGGVAVGEVTDFNSLVAPAPISFDPAYPEALVGVSYSPRRVKDLLEAIGCQVSPAGGQDAETSGRLGAQAGAGDWLVIPPSWRIDLTRPVDLVEEVARLDGYDKIESVLPAAPPGTGLTTSQRLRRSVARALADFGLVEVLTYPFVGHETFDQLGLSPDDGARQAVKLANPLDSAAGLMRTALLQTLLGAARRNAGRGLTDLGLFELGLVTNPAASLAPVPVPPADCRPAPEVMEQIFAGVPAQPRHVAGVLMGQRQLAGVWGPGRAADWADSIEAARVVARACHVALEVQQDCAAPYHPGRCARLKVAGAAVGCAGELHPEACRNFGLPARTSAFELNLDALIQVSPAVVQAQELRTQPVAKEDLAFVVASTVAAGAVVEAVRGAVGDLAESVEVFDVYAGDQVPAGSKSVAVALRLRAADRTLSPEDVAGARNRAVKAVAKQLGGELRA